MEIGGYMELEHLGGRPWHREVYELNLGRTALVWLLTHIGCRTLFVPWFLCDSVTQACSLAGIALEYYRIDEDLVPLPERKPEDGEYLYLVNYYGQLTDEQIIALNNRYGRVIVDHTHDFFRKPVPGIPAIWSCRKFFGVSDGAYLYYEGELPLPEETDQSHGRMTHLLGRYECRASDFYGDMLATADTFHTEPAKKMSPLTKNILGAVPYDAVRKRRHSNYLYLREHLPQDHVLSRHTPDAPFCYPYYVKNGIRIRRALARRDIYIPTCWNNVISRMPEDSTEYDLAANVLALPCDQRYGTREMAVLTKAVLDTLHDMETLL